MTTWKAYSSVVSCPALYKPGQKKIQRFFSHPNWLNVPHCIKANPPKVGSHTKTNTVYSNRYNRKLKYFPSGTFPGDQLRPWGSVTSSEISYFPGDQLLPWRSVTSLEISYFPVDQSLPWRSVTSLEISYFPGDQLLPWGSVTFLEISYFPGDQLLPWK